MSKIMGGWPFTLDIEYYYLNSKSYDKNCFGREIILLWLEQHNDSSRDTNFMEYSNKAVIGQIIKKTQVEGILVLS